MQFDLAVLDAHDMRLTLSSRTLTKTPLLKGGV